jgi:hypothetical protein
MLLVHVGLADLQRVLLIPIYLKAQPAIEPARRFLGD